MNVLTLAYVFGAASSVVLAGMGVKSLRSPQDVYVPENEAVCRVTLPETSTGTGLVEIFHSTDGQEISQNQTPIDSIGVQHFINRNGSEIIPGMYRYESDELVPHRLGTGGHFRSAEVDMEKGTCVIYDHNVAKLFQADKALHFRVET